MYSFCLKNLLTAAISCTVHSSNMIHLVQVSLLAVLLLLPSEVAIFHLQYVFCRHSVHVKW